MKLGVAAGLNYVISLCFLKDLFCLCSLILQPFRSSFLWGILMVRVSGTPDVLVSVAQAERV